VPKKLLIATGIYPPDAGGPAKFAEEFGNWLISEDLDVQVITYSNNLAESSSKSRISISRIGRFYPLPQRILKFVHGIGTLQGDGQGVLVIGAFIEAYLASIIYSFPYIAKVPGDIVWERARNNKVTDLDIESFQHQRLNFKYRLFRALYTKSLKSADFVVVPSMGLYKLCLMWGISESKLKLIYNSVESKTRTARKESQQVYNIITVCRLVPWKGVDELIIYAANRKKKMLIVGDGPEKSHLEALANSLQADVIFEGEVSQRRVLELLSVSELFVLNSRYEGLPHALVEARVAGVLSVGRAGTGSAEVINDDQDGFLIRLDRPLEETLDLAIQMQPNSDSMIALAKEDSLKRFSKEVNFPLILSLFLGEV